MSFITYKNKVALIVMCFWELDFKMHDRLDFSFSGEEKGDNVAMKTLLTQAGALGLPSKK